MFLYYIILTDDLVEKLCDQAFIIDDKQDTPSTYASDSEDDLLPSTTTGIPKVAKLPPVCDDSDYTSSSDDDESRAVTPLVDDTNSKRFRFLKFLLALILPLALAIAFHFALLQSFWRK